MVSFEPSRDLGIVRTILTHPDIWPYIGDDFAPDAKDWQPNADPRIQYLLAVQGTKLIGLFMALPQSHVCAELHLAILPEHRGERSHAAGKAFLPWVWGNTGFHRVVGQAPNFNPRIIRYCTEVIGMQPFGVNEKSFLKHGRLWDQTLVGASRPE